MLVQRHPAAAKVPRSLVRWIYQLRFAKLTVLSRATTRSCCSEKTSFRSLHRPVEPDRMYDAYTTDLESFESSRVITDSRTECLNPAEKLPDKKLASDAFGSHFSGETKMATHSTPNQTRNRRSEFDEEHSQTEDCWITLGLDRTGTLLVVWHGYREGTESSARIRLISARKATKNEIKQYKKK